MTTEDKKEISTTEKKIIETSSTDGEFAEYILAELIARGLSGENLIAEYNKKLAKVRPAVEAMIIDAEKRQ